MMGDILAWIDGPGLAWFAGFLGLAVLVLGVWAGLEVRRVGDPFDAEPEEEEGELIAELNAEIDGLAGDVQRLAEIRGET